MLFIQIFIFIGLYISNSFSQSIISTTITSSGLSRKYKSYEPNSWTNNDDAIIYFHGQNGNYDQAFTELLLDYFAEKHNFLVISPEGLKVEPKSLTAMGKVVLEDYEFSPGKSFEISHVENGIQILGSEYKGKDRCDSKDIEFVRDIIKDLESNGKKPKNFYAIGTERGGFFAYYLTQCYNEAFKKFVGVQTGVMLVNLESLKELSPETYKVIINIPVISKAIKDCTMYYPIPIEKEVDGLLFQMYNISAEDFGFDEEILEMAREWVVDLSELLHMNDFPTLTIEYYLGNSAVFSEDTMDRVIDYLYGNRDAFNNGGSDYDIYQYTKKFEKKPVPYGNCVSNAVTGVTITAISFTVFGLCCCITLLLCTIWLCYCAFCKKKGDFKELTDISNEVDIDINKDEKVTY